MSNNQLYQTRPWLYGLIWGWSLFLILTFIDYWNGELQNDRLLPQFVIWTVGGLAVGYGRKFLTERFG